MTTKLEAIRVRLAKIPPMEWVQIGNDIASDVRFIAAVDHEEDADFIANAADDIRLLLDVAQAAKEHFAVTAIPTSMLRKSEVKLLDALARLEEVEGE